MDGDVQKQRGTRKSCNFLSLCITRASSTRGGEERVRMSSVKVGGSVMRGSSLQFLYLVSECEDSLYSRALGLGNEGDQPVGGLEEKDQTRTRRGRL